MRLPFLAPAELTNAAPARYDDMRQGIENNFRGLTAEERDVRRLAD
jgi:hypothetical protein